MLIRDAQVEKKEDPRILRTRRLLRDALGSLLREKSFDAITVGEITERATLNRVTFYAHFPDKYALLEYSMGTLIRERLEDELGSAPALSEAAIQQLLLIVCSFLADIESHCPPPRGQLQPLMEKQIKQELYTLLLDSLHGAKPRRSAALPTAEQAAMVTAWAIYGAAFQWSQQKKPQPAADFVRQVLPLIHTNIQPYYDKPHTNGAGRSIGGRAPSTLLSPVFRLHPYAI
jgi:AcrR family transcriptional regulator